jgi:aminoglycoside phosphotransferase (APT) family kinase protein
VQPEEEHAIACALGSEVIQGQALAGGFSRETSLVTLTNGQVVARLGGTDPLIEAAVMTAAGRYVPVPRVLCTLAGSGDGPRAGMVLEHVTGTLLSDVLAAGATCGGQGLDELGAEVGRVLAAISQVSFDRPGFFTDSALAIAPERPWSQQLPEFAAACMANAPADRLDLATRTAWVDLCTAHAPSLAAIDDHARLVHSDANPKNILVSAVGGSWRVNAVLDWESSYSGCPYADAANMLRFGTTYPGSFRNGFRAGFAAHQPAGLPLAEHWLYLGRVHDMFAISDLATRPGGHPIADQAADQMRRWLADGIPGSPA